jgi:hypothetical protein
MLVSGVGKVSSSCSPLSGIRRTSRAPFSGPMALIVLTAICFFSCVFLLFVLVKWMRDTKRKTKTRPVVDNNVGETHQETRPHVVVFRKNVGKRDRLKAGAHRMSTIAERLSGRESWYGERERIAYERIARSWRPDQRI